MILTNVEVVSDISLVPRQYHSLKKLQNCCEFSFFLEILRNVTSRKFQSVLQGNTSEGPCRITKRVLPPNFIICPTRSLYITKFKAMFFTWPYLFYRTCNKCAGSICFCCANCRGWSRGRTSRSLLAFQDWTSL